MNIPAQNGSAPDQMTLLTLAEALAFLREGSVEDCQLHPYGSNYTFVALLKSNGLNCLAIYKPRDGERPLWDFPAGTLYRREVASYVLCEALGWGFVPPTIIRDGPHGEGSIQLYIQHDPEINYFHTRETHEDMYQMMAAFDLIANNADRKAGHCLLSQDRNIWGIDHGLTFNIDPKLRTVIWDFAEQPIPQRFLADIKRVSEELGSETGVTTELVKLLNPEEIAKLRLRMETVLEHPNYPPPYSRRSMPWPYV